MAIRCFVQAHLTGVHVFQDKLAADVRVETERRLKSLEADLETSERRRKERSLAMRYHKVKFFGECGAHLIYTASDRRLHHASSS